MNSFDTDWVPVDQFEMIYDKKNVLNPFLIKARKMTESEWDKIPLINWKLPHAGGLELHANEQSLKASTLNKVNQSNFKFRQNYYNKFAIDQEGKAHIVDGHHRIAMHILIGHNTIPAKVINYKI